MRVVVVTPADPIITLAEAKQHLRVDHDDENALIEGLVAAATAHVDGPAGWLGRAIGVQTLECGLAGFSSERFKLPYPPVISVERVDHEDEAGEWQVLPADDYEFRDGWLGYVRGGYWPTTLSYRGRGLSTVRVRYQSGYEIVPPPIRVAVLLMVDDLYRNRGNSSDRASTAVQMPTTSEMLLQPFRKYA